MGNDSRKEALAAFHRDRIAAAAEVLFAEKGFDGARIDDISAASGYSRRTVYAYFDSKEDILCRILENGLRELKDGLEAALGTDKFIHDFRAACVELLLFRRRHPCCVQAVMRSGARPSQLTSMASAGRVFALGDDINSLLAGLISRGQTQGIVEKSLPPALCAQILFTCVNAAADLALVKSGYISEAFSMDSDEFFSCALEQLLNGILVEKHGSLI